MKKTGLLCLGLLLIASSLCAQGIPMPRGQNGTGAGGTGGTTVYCTAAATCTATNPGYCSYLCEDMEGTNPCWLTGPSYCRQAANDWTVALGGSTAITVAGPNAPLCSGTTNTNGGFNIAVVTTSAQDAYISKHFATALVDFHLEFYLTIVSHSLPIGTYAQLAALDVPGMLIFNTLYLVNAAGTPTLELWYQVTTPVDTPLGSPRTIAMGTPYRINIDWNNLGNISWSVNGTQVAAATDAIQTEFVQDLVFGSQAEEGNTARTYTFQIDNIAVDEFNTPGACQ